MDAFQKIPCTLFPQGAVNILLPNGAIEELVKVTITKDKDFYTIDWQGQTIPVVTLLAQHIDLHTPQMVIVVRLPESSDHIGLLATRIPKVIQSNQRNLTEDSQPRHLVDTARSYVVIAGTNAIIPDLMKCYHKYIT